MAVEFVNHHVHSHFSTLDGLSTPQEIVQRAVELGQRSISVTDHGTMSGIPQMYKAAKDAGIGFTPGCEVYFTTERSLKSPDRLGEKYYHMILLAHNQEGYENLSHLQTLGWEEGFYQKPRIDYAALEEHHKGLTVTTACLGGIVNQYLLRDDIEGAERELGKLVDIFGKDNTYVEIQNHGIDEQIQILGQQRDMAKKFGLKMIATSDSHYCTHDEADVHDSLLCTATKAEKSMPGSYDDHAPGEKTRFKFASDQNFIHSGERMLELFPELEFPGAVTNTVELAEKTDFTMNMGKGKKYLMPITGTSDGKSDAQVLREHVYAGAGEMFRYGDAEGNIPQDVQERIDYELSVIEKMRFSSYFLIMENLINIFTENDIQVGPGRGCLHPNTEVLTDRGWLAIHSVRVGDTVITADGSRGVVHDVLQHELVEGEKLVKLTNDNGETIRLTAKHKIRVSDHHGNHKWKRAGDIITGDIVVSTWGKSTPEREFCLSESHHLPEDSPLWKTPQWGYIVGMLVSRAIYPDDETIQWFFEPEEETIAETLLNCLSHTVVDTFPEIIHHDKGGISTITLRHKVIAQWMRKKMIDHDMFIGMGTTHYTRMFLQATHQGYSTTPNFKTATANSVYEAQVMEYAGMSIGRMTTRSDETVEITRRKSKGLQRMSMIIDVDRVTPDVDHVYDLTISGGHPSFLTKFSTVHNSAPGSVVVYCLGITNVDPLAHDLYFERFLNPDRISMPDIDVDIPKSQRQRAMQLIEQEYGKGHVAHLSNYNKMGMRDAILRAAKVYGMIPSAANTFRDIIATWCEERGESLEEFSHRGTPPREIANKLPETNHYNKIVTTAVKFVGRMMGNGVHASGILITDEPLEKNFPLRKAKDAYLPVCQYDGTDTESIGGVKFDLLGLINLDECENTEKNILIDLHEEVDSSDLPLDDEEVYELLSEGRGGGIFQLGCLSGDTIVDGKPLKELYAIRRSIMAEKEVRSVFLGKGQVAPNLVENIVCSGMKNTIRITTKDHQLRCTPDHKLFTQNGWKPAGDIQPGVDQLLTVNNDVGHTHVPLGIRGREDVLELYAATFPEYTIVEDPQPVTIFQESFYPTHYNETTGEYVYLYPDSSGGVIDRLKDEAKYYPDYRKVVVLSYSEAVEKCYEHDTTVCDGILLPRGTQWSQVESSVDAGECMTYDIMMKTPVHNFVANGIMTHNSSGISSLARKMRPTEFNDLSAILALYRPGPMGLGTHDEYSERKNGLKPITADHEEMEEILKKTYALTIFQEDIMSLAKHFAGYTGGEADELRKAVAKKNPVLLEEQKRKFIPRVNENYEDNLGQKLWDIIEPFGQYAFNKSHSVAYALLTYRTAWLKTHYPAQFAGAVMDENLSDKDKIFETITWIKKEGIQVLPPSIQDSELRSTTTIDSISLPLHIIKGLGDRKAQEIIDEREAHGEFSSIVDVISRCSLSGSLVVSMTKAGAFDCFNVDRAAVINELDTIMSLAKSKRSRNSLSAGLFAESVVEDDPADIIDLETQPEYVEDNGKSYLVGDDLYSSWERETMGVLLGKHPFTNLRQLDAVSRVFRRYPPVDEAESEVHGVKFSGIVTNITNKISKRTKREYCNFTLETDSVMIPGVAFTHFDVKNNGAFVVLEGDIENDGSEDVFEPQIICRTMRKVNVERLKELSDGKEG